MLWKELDTSQKILLLCLGFVTMWGRFYVAQKRAVVTQLGFKNEATLKLKKDTKLEFVFKTWKFAWALWASAEFCSAGWASACICSHTSANTEAAYVGLVRAPKENWPLMGSQEAVCPYKAQWFWGWGLSCHRQYSEVGLCQVPRSHQTRRRHWDLWHLREQRHCHYEDGICLLAAGCLCSLLKSAGTWSQPNLVWASPHVDTSVGQYCRDPRSLNVTATHVWEGRIVSDWLQTLLHKKSACGFQRHLL